ncbi:FG-GAP-like repeat-containing protein [Plantactinospora soyae]|uniref:Peptidase C51 domain-containing protein n=1 Tax=Plantactinospora soyae TaxID=1544732 RepID=A0A927R7B6_9ACTN|nr:FG-GAP-like repeat-containing protein [Plantactinospora soyae]MBE1489269.1 hypothetical protein [Plantactinospora soyae]
MSHVVTTPSGRQTAHRSFAVLLALLATITVSLVVLPAAPAAAATRAGIVAVARAEVGVAEPTGCDKYDIDCSATPWCAYFAAWVWRRAGVSPVFTTGVARGVGQWGVERGLFTYRSSGTRPSPGDIVVYGPPGNFTGGHVGIVESVASNGYLTTIEGNYDNKVTRRTNLNPATATGSGHSISGYVRPPNVSNAQRELNGDRHSDLVGVTVADQSLLRYDGRGNGTFGASVRLGAGWSSTRMITVGDVNGDGSGDLLTVRSDGSLYWYRGSGGGFAVGAKIWSGGWGNFRLITSADVNRDGRTDLLALNNNHSLYLYRGQADGTVASAGVVATGLSATRLMSATDVNGDGASDLLMVNNDGNLYIRLGTATGSFAAGVSIGVSWGAMRLITATDYTGDGRGDLLAARTDGTLHLYTGTANGRVNSAVQVGNGWNGIRIIGT